MLARLAAALQRGQLQGLGGAQLGAALGGGGTVVVNEDCNVSQAPIRAFEVVRPITAVVCVQFYGVSRLPKD